MDMSFANQALVTEYLYKEGSKLENKVYSVPEDIDHLIANLKLKAMQVGIDVLTPAQIAYLSSWQEGT
jgi:adenosylhomocysteinase